MAQSGARSLGTRTTNTERGVTTRRDRGGLTPAQLYCLLAGLALLLAGIFGFIADASFDTGATQDTDAGGNGDGALQGDSFLGFEVNGWHNVVHIASGILLLAAFSRRTAAKTVALVFGIVYGAVALIGLIDGNDVFGLIPVNAADNILHIALSLVGILAALASPGDRDELRTSTATPRDEAVGRTAVTHTRDDRFDRDDETLADPALDRTPADTATGTTTDPTMGRGPTDR